MQIIIAIIWLYMRKYRTYMLNLWWRRLWFSGLFQNLSFAFVLTVRERSILVFKATHRNDVSRRPICTVFLFPLSYSPAHRLCSHPVLRSRCGRSPWHGPDHPARAEDYTRRVEVRREMAEICGFRAKITEKNSALFCQDRLCGERVARSWWRAYFAARFGRGDRAGLSNLLLARRGDSGHSRRNGTMTKMER